MTAIDAVEPPLPGARPNSGTAPTAPAPRSARAARLANLRRLFGWSALVLLITWLALPGGGWQGIYAIGLRLLSLELIALTLATWIGVAIIVPAWRPRTVLWPAFLVGLLVFAVGLIASRTPRLGADYLAYTLLLVALYLLLQRLLANAFFRERIGTLTIGLLVLIGGWFVVSVGLDWIRWWGLVGRITTPPLRPYFEGLTYGNPSAVMTMAVLLLGPSVAYLGFGSAWRRIVAAGLTGLVLLVTLLSGSRAGWLGLAIGLAFTVVIWLTLPDNRRAVGRLITNVRARIAVGVVLVAGAVAGVLFAPAILLRADAGGEDLRSSLYQSGIRMFQDAPLLGHGPGTWVVLRSAHTLPGEIDYYIPHAHSIYVQTLAEFGLLGVAAGVVIVASLAWLIRNAIVGPDPVRRRFGWAALLGTAYFAAHQLLDFYPNMPAALFSFALPIAWLDATSPAPLTTRLGRWPAAWMSAVRSARWLRPLGAVAGTALVVVSIGWLWRSESAATQMSRGGTFADDGDWASALPDFRAAVAADPDMPPYQLELGIAAANTGDLATAASALERSASTDNLPAAWLDLAAVRLAQTDSAGAGDALVRALVLGNQDAGINLAAGVVALGLGDTAGARSSFVLAVTLAPSLAGDPWWQSTPALAALWPDVLAESTAAAAGLSGVDMALSAGNVERARALASALPDKAGRDLAALVIGAWGGDATAIAALYAQASAHPLDPLTLSWCARVASRSGDEARANAFRAWMDGPNPGSSDAGYEVRVSAARVTNVAGIRSLFYGHYSYRRPTPFDQLVASLPHLAFE